MSKVEIKLNTNGVKELLRSEEMKAECERRANETLGRLGSGYVVTTHTGKTRVNASIFAESNKARRENMEQNTILKALR